MIDALLIKRKEQARNALESTCNDLSISFDWDDTNANLCTKINTNKGL